MTKDIYLHKEFIKNAKTFSKVPTYAPDNEEDYHIKRVL
jgi:hypothetical protein